MNREQLYLIELCDIQIIQKTQYKAMRKNLNVRARKNATVSLFCFLICCILFIPEGSIRSIQVKAIR